MRDTSVEAWRYIQDSGVLSKRRLEAYSALFQYGPRTAGELETLCEHRGMWKRLSELRDLGVVKECGKRPCRVTDRNAIVWDVTSAMPQALRIKRPKRNSRHVHNPLTCDECAALVDRAWQARHEASDQPRLL
jgi:hypothetical protein